MAAARLKRSVWTCSRVRRRPQWTLVLPALAAAAALRLLEVALALSAPPRLLLPPARLRRALALLVAAMPRRLSASRRLLSLPAAVAPLPRLRLLPRPPPLAPLPRLSLAPLCRLRLLWTLRACACCVGVHVRRLRAACARAASCRAAVCTVRFLA